ncbi:hypothetical protein LX64_01258 [Chitinophaga skermanii]|uniref:Natural product n=1 Tax=Chitinophaga skermanii TaxID=331697 RepID=A0A327QXC2_9BACT|nr:class I lanthipeptide [Chitinophaga skermanii]RAJ08605.1 hypothetical protein LX64_01258 [Chitinophaga skermanii]
MKKKKLDLQKKLNINKSTVAQLTTDQQALVKGGIITLNVRCETNQASCNTFRWTEDQCILC